MQSREDWFISTTQRFPGPPSFMFTAEALSNRWLEILWHCLSKGVLYDETVHIANRNRALAHAA